MPVWFLMWSSAFLFTFTTSQYHCPHTAKLCHEGTFSCTGLPHSPHLFHHLWVWLLTSAHRLFSSSSSSPFSALPGGFEHPFPAIFTQFLACSGAGTQCCYQLPTSWGMWSELETTEGWEHWECSCTQGRTGQGCSLTETSTPCLRRRRNADPQEGIFWF